MKFTDPTVRTWLGLAFGAVVLLGAATAGMGVYKLAQTQAQLQEVVQTSNTTTRIAYGLSDSVHTTARETRALVLLQDRGEKEAGARKISQARAQYNQQWAALQAVPGPTDTATDTAADTAAHAKVEQARHLAQPLADKVLALSLAGRDDEATALLLREAAPATQKWQDAVDASLALQERANVQLHQAAQADHLAARNLLVGIGLASAVLAALLVLLLGAARTSAPVVLLPSH